MADAQNTDAQSARVGAFEYVISRNNASEDSVIKNSDIKRLVNLVYPVRMTDDAIIDAIIAMRDRFYRNLTDNETAILIET